MFAGVKLGEACTIVLRGATQQILDEAERSLHDALCVLSQTVKETKTVFGGGEHITCQLLSIRMSRPDQVTKHFDRFRLVGSSEMLMANAVSQLAAKTPGKEAMAMESFAKALRQVLWPQKPVVYVFEFVVRQRSWSSCDLPYEAEKNKFLQTKC